VARGAILPLRWEKSIGLLRGERQLGAAADLDEARRGDGLTSEEWEELRRLRRENPRLRLEREI
jgi:hypothetical protein